MEKDKIEIGISLNNTCNLSCRMCRIWNHDPAENRLTLEKCSQIIDELAVFAVKGVRLSGGDPLLVPWALDLAALISRKQYHSVATTNGSMIDEAMAKKIIDSGLSNLNLSLDASNPQLHDSIRGKPGCYQRIMSAIDHLSKNKSGPVLGINTVISGLNLDNIIELAEKVEKDRRISHIYFMAVMQPFGSPVEKQWYLKEEFRCLWPENGGKAAKVLDRLIRLKRAGYKINNSAAQLKTFIDYFNDPEHFTRKNKCNLGKEVLEINQVGDAFLCYSYESIGNVFNETISQIWRSGKAAEARKKIERCDQNCNLLINCYFEEEHV